MRVLLEKDTVASARRLAVVHDAVAQPAGARADERRAWRSEGRWDVSGWWTTRGDEGRRGETSLGGRPDTREAGAYQVAAPAESK